MNTTIPGSGLCRFVDDNVLKFHDLPLLLMDFSKGIVTSLYSLASGAPSQTKLVKTGNGTDLF